MTDPEFLLSLLILLFFILNLVVAAARSGLSNMNMARLLTQRETWGQDVDRTLDLFHTSRRHLAGLYVLQMLARFATVGAIFVQLIRTGSISLNNLLLPGLWLLGLALVFSWLEWIVAAWVSIRPEIWSMRLGTFIRVTGFLLYPFTFLPLSLTHSADGKMESIIRVTEEELKTMVDAGEQEGLIEQEERKMIYSIFDLGETLVREIMVPRIDVLALEVSVDVTRAVDALLASGYSRVPVYEETIDNVVGLLYAKDLLNAWRSGDQSRGLKDLLRPAYFVPEAKKVDELLAEMQKRRIHMAIIVDEYGGVAGLVTLEDIVEEIVGEIHDEFDLGEDTFFQKVGPEDFICDGRMDLDDFNELMGADLPVDEADTLGGFIYSQIGRVPTGGESVLVGGDLRLTVEQVSKRSIRTVRVQRNQAAGNEQEEETNVHS